jgi:uncharacterized protein (TIGR02246 family)
MRSRTAVTLALLGLGVCLAWAVAQKPAAADEDAVRKAVEAYAAAYAKGDFDTVMASWAPGAEFVDESGAVTRGKDAIAALFKKAWADRKGVPTVRVKVTTVRVLRPDLAALDGTVEVTAPDGRTDSGPFASLWTKADGKWLILSVRDLPDPSDDNPSAARVRQLDWLVGEWVNEDRESTVTMNCRLTEKQSFLVIDQVVSVRGEEVLTLKQVIGWDPLRQQLRSWVFDSRGGFGEGSWSRDGNLWTIDAAGVLSDGREASSVNSYRYLDENSFEWASVNREVGGQPQSDMKVRYTRKAAKK